MKTKIYVLLDSANKIRYVGKTSKTLEKRIQRHLYEAKSRMKNHRCNWIRSLLQQEMLPTIRKIAEVEGDGCKEEISWISFFKTMGIKLTNGTNGGEGLLNPSNEVRRKISEGNKGKIISIETRKKISEGNKGRKLSLTSRKKNSEVHKGINTWSKGKIVSVETKKKLSANNAKFWLGKNISEETKKKISNTKKGHPSGREGKHHSWEARKKMSIAKKKYYWKKKHGQ